MLDNLSNFQPLFSESSTLPLEQCYIYINILDEIMNH